MSSENSTPRNRTDPVTAHCLDLTRLISRVGRGPWTGVDRVELAYLRHLLEDPLPLFLLVKSAFGYVLLDQHGAEAIHARLTKQVPWGRTDFLGWLTRKASAAKQRAEADLRRLCVARCRRKSLRVMLQKALPQGSAYLNVGHSNLTNQVLSAWKAVPNSRVSVLIHDTIPLDFPQYQRPGTPEVFEQKLKTVVEQADLIICNSAQTERDVMRWAREWGSSVNTIVAHLGLDLKNNHAVAKATNAQPPYFVCLGTIEPRKNHALLLSVWEQFHEDLPTPEIPDLHIVGARGWSNEAVFSRLDRFKATHQSIVEHVGMQDDALGDLIANAAGMLFPSVAEGYGLPPLEAISMGVPVICTKLDVYEEFLGNIPVYLESDDVYLWKQSILRLKNKKQAGQTENARFGLASKIPTWRNHFNLVLKMT